MAVMNNHDIAIELCKMLEKEFGKNLLHSQTFLSEDAIELRTFVDVVNLLLYLKSPEGWCTFSDEIFQYKGKPMKDIPDCKEIHEKFLDLL